MKRRSFQPVNLEIRSFNNSFKIPLCQFIILNQADIYGICPTLKFETKNMQDNISVPNSDFSTLSSDHF